MEVSLCCWTDMLGMKETWGQTQFVVATTPASTVTTSTVTSAVTNSTVANTTVVEFSSSPSIGELFRKLDEVRFSLIKYQ